LWGTIGKGEIEIASHACWYFFELYQFWLGIQPLRDLPGGLQSFDLMLLSTIKATSTLLLAANIYLEKYGAKNFPPIASLNNISVYIYTHMAEERGDVR
jgi:hypothetical protein